MTVARIIASPSVRLAKFKSSDKKVMSARSKPHTRRIRPTNGIHRAKVTISNGAHNGSFIFFRILQPSSGIDGLNCLAHHSKSSTSGGRRRTSSKATSCRTRLAFIMDVGSLKLRNVATTPNISGNMDEMCFIFVVVERRFPRKTRTTTTPWAFPADKERRFVGPLRFEHNSPKYTKWTKIWFWVLEPVRTPKTCKTTKTLVTKCCNEPSYEWSKNDMQAIFFFESSIVKSRDFMGLAQRRTPLKSPNFERFVR